MEDLNSRLELLEGKLSTLEQSALGQRDELASAIANLSQTLDKFSKQLRRQERLNTAQAGEISKLRKITLGVVAVVAVFWFAGDRTLDQGSVEIGEIVQLVGIIAGGGVATAAITQPTPAQQQPSFEEDVEEEGDRP